MRAKHLRVRHPVGLLGACVLVVASAAGCAVSLDPEPTPRAARPAEPPLVSCLPASERVEALEGRLGAVTLADGGELFIAGAARFAGNDGPAALRDPDGAACLAHAEPLSPPLIDTTPLGASLSAQPLGAVTAESAYLFFTAVRGANNEGIGIARWDAHASRFVAVSWLWTADRPSYGSGAVVDGEFVYVYGGLAARYLAADAYVARVHPGDITEPAAYEYWVGGGSYASNADEAAPLVEAGTSPSIAYDAAHGRWLLAYATPLATEISVRSGLGVTGPWSLPVTLGRCDLPTSDAGAFCGDVTLVPALASGAELTLTQAVGTFARAPNAVPGDYWTRVVSAPWPSELP